MRRFTDEQLAAPARAIAHASGVAEALVQLQEDETGLLHGRVAGCLVVSGDFETVIKATAQAAADHARQQGDLAKSGNGKKGSSKGGP